MGWRVKVVGEGERIQGVRIRLVGWIMIGVEAGDPESPKAGFAANIYLLIKLEFCFKI